MKLDLSRQIFSKNIQISTLIKIRPMGAELLYADERKDRLEINYQFSQICLSV